MNIWDYVISYRKFYLFYGHFFYMGNPNHSFLIFIIYKNHAYPLLFVFWNVFGYQLLDLPPSGPWIVRDQLSYVALYLLFLPPGFRHFLLIQPATIKYFMYSFTFTLLLINVNALSLSRTSSLDNSSSQSRSCSFVCLVSVTMVPSGRKARSSSYNQNNMKRICIITKILKRFLILRFPKL